jgi:ubiquinone/menaquinone biosynthesis C-methylase UbiE
VSRELGMRKESLQFLCCPVCHGDLRLTVDKTSKDVFLSGSLECDSCRRTYGMENGIPDFLLPETLNEKDKKWMLTYDRMSLSYDIIMSYVVPFFSIGQEPFERRAWVKRLRVVKGARVLDVSTGTGRNLPFINRQVGPQGRLAAMDISNGMLAYAKMKMDRRGLKNIELQRANASLLPYKENSFDAVMHVGGVNTFGDGAKAMNEMVRVAKPNARIVIVDEGLSPHDQKTFLGKFLIKTNALYKCEPPIMLLPKNVGNTTVKWKIVYSTLVNTSWPYYILEFEKANLQKEAASLRSQ